MFGDGISIIDLHTLLKSIREKNLVLQVKIIDGSWEDISATVINKMVKTITSGNVTESSDIRLRLSNRSVHESLNL